MKKIAKSEKIILKKYLTDRQRIAHSISTAVMMKKYAPFFDLDREKAYWAGLYHDLAKEQPVTMMIELAARFKNRGLVDIRYYEFKLQHPFLLHGIASAEIMLTELGIQALDILEAACCHTIGGENISPLARYTFMADFAEPLREYPPSKKVHKILTKEKNFDKAYYYTYVYLLKSLIKRKKIICMESLDGYNQALQIWS